jgi:hypothetical protein
MDPEKTKKEGLIRRLLANDKLVALITFLSAAVAFSLSLVALLSGGGNGKLQNYDVVMVSCHCPRLLGPTPLTTLSSS